MAASKDLSEGDSGAQKTGRFVISHRIAHLKAQKERDKARDSFAAFFDAVLKPEVDVVEGAVRSSGKAGQGSLLRQVMTIVGDREDIAKKLAEGAGLKGAAANSAAGARQIREDLLLEEEAPRQPMALRSAYMAQSLAALREAGSGTPLTIYLRRGTTPVPGVKVTVSLMSLKTGGGTASLSQVSDSNGQVTFSYAGAEWYPSSAQTEPNGQGWSAVIYRVWNGMVLNVAALPENGPQSWWHRLVGATKFDRNAGKGMRIGIVDTGCGPHPYLDHVTGVGGIDAEGVFQPLPELAADVEQHGTHVCGIIAARPPEDSKAFAGLAPGADVFMARAVGSDGLANQGQIAAAIDTLVEGSQVDLINISLGSTVSSAIEYDALLYAYLNGVSCVCAAGNSYGQAVMAPACYPEALAVSALGLYGTAPADNLAQLTVPAEAQKIAGNGIYLASYSNVGPQLAVTAPGSAIISTIPVTDGEAAPYMDMSGTSMASPLSCAALAVMLADDPIYRYMQRDEKRSEYVRLQMQYRALNLGLQSTYQGKGLVRTA